ncbi:MAG: potassium-transporting ATPase subunit KdpC [Lachnospiraceae bacterium]
MKNMKTLLPKAIILILVCMLLCGVIYPLMVTGISQIFFSKTANGSMIEVDGKRYGSQLLGQQFADDTHMWGRIMQVDTDTFRDAKGRSMMYAAPSNLSPASEEFAELVEERVTMIKEANPDAKMDAVPVELVTGSGSGLDPHISVAAATYQIPRLAVRNQQSEAQVEEIIDRYTTGRFLGIFGEPVVNVLEVNLALDGIL